MKLLLYDIRSCLIYFYNIFFRKGIYSTYVDFKASIGKKTVINMGTHVDRNSVIGSYTYLGKSTWVTKATIGNYCSIANNVFIGQGEHDISKISTSDRFSDDNELTKEVCLIGNDVWIGSNVCILRGVSVGNGAVIGAGAVVTKNVPPYAVVVGLPAKVLKYRFPEEKIKKITESKWWNYTPKEAKKIIDSL